MFVCASGNVRLLHTVAMATGDCGPLAVGRIVSADGNNFMSVLTVTAPDVHVSGSVLPVQCTFPQPLPDPPVVVMEYSVTVTGECLMWHTHAYKYMCLSVCFESAKEAADLVPCLP